ncbi:MAG: hypothetical protein AAF380_02470 [Bacteroidota bacterium]
MDKKTWIDMLTGGLDMFGNPDDEFAKYEYNTLIRFYDNYLDYSTVFLYEDAFLEMFIDEYAKKFSIPEFLTQKLDELRRKIDKFYDECKEMDDFTLIKRPEWEEIKPLAKECIEELNKLKNK